MAVTTAKIGSGTLLKAGDGGGPEVFTTVLEQVELSGPSEALETVDATHQESPSSAREFIAGLIDPGELSGTGHFLLDSTQTNLRNDLVNRTKRNFQLVVPFATPKTYSFSGFVTQFEPTFPVDDKMTYAFAIKVTGLPTIA